MCVGDLKWESVGGAKEDLNLLDTTGLLRPDDGGGKNSRKEGRTQEEPSKLDTRSPGEERVTRHDYRVNSKFLFVVRELRFWPCVRTLSSTHNAGLKGKGGPVVEMDDGPSLFMTSTHRS